MTTKTSIQIIGDSNQSMDLTKPLLKQGRKWLKRKVTMDELEQRMISQKKIYHPMWVAKMLIIAERKPFPPRITPNMGFVDAVSGYRGLFTNVPPFQSVNSDGLVARPILKSEDQLQPYIQDLQSQINKKYLLKKPKHEIREVFLSYLPLWEYTIKTESGSQTFYLNANTGESEEFLSKLWEDNSWLLNK